MRKNLGEVNFDLALVPAAPLAWRPTQQMIVRSLWPVPRHKHLPFSASLEGPGLTPEKSSYRHVGVQLTIIPFLRDWRG